MNECIFCQIVRGDAKSWKVYEDSATYAFLDVNPYSEFHALVIPKTHYTDVFDLPGKNLMDVMRSVKAVVSLYESKLGLCNVQIFNSSGAEAQQDVLHVHFHVVPRSAGDGLDLHRTTHPEYRERFDAMLKQLATNN
ncbi:MAG TPA: HIT domain-containing protein [Acidimicrobiales bacterium]|nr:HIT domain-containing protein [Acidimicrobiales bacterium]